MTPRSLLAQIAEVEREISLRRRVYAGLVARRTMKQGEAEERINLMQNVLETLMRLERAERGLDEPRPN
jgi:hypothetical protein